MWLHSGSVTAAFALPPYTSPADTAVLRAQVRAFLAANPPPADAVRRADGAIVAHDRIPRDAVLAAVAAAALEA